MTLYFGYSKLKGSMENRELLSKRLDSLSVIALSLFLFLFPIIIVDFTTDAFIVPKQAILAFVALGGVFFLGLKGIITNGVRFKRTPFDLPILLFGLAAILSSIFAVNKNDSFIALVPFLFAILLFFVITNFIKKEKDLLYATSALILGGAVVSIITLLSYFKLFILPFPFAKVQTFTPFGSLFDQALYLIVILSIALYTAWPALRKREVNRSRLVFVGGAFFILLGIAISILAAFTIQKPTILPYQTGFQTAFASISQDTGRVIQGFLMGSGLGTYITDFTRFKPATINADATLWSLSFLRSSSYALELLATTGLLGILSFVFLAYRILRTKPLFIPLVVLLIFAVIFPFAFTEIVLLFAVLGIYSAQQALSERQKHKFFDVELKLVALRRGVLALTDPGSKVESEYGNLLPVAFLIGTGVFTLLLGIMTARFLVSDYMFQQSLVAASQNNAQKTYQLETDAIRMFPQRDGYHRIFSQINLSLANNIALSIPQGSSPSAETQQTIVQLIQQAINSGRNATTISPQTAINWQNLSSIYRSLIGFGQNADQFALLTAQQALALDPNNPQQYINFGGIYYQLQQWDNAIRQFQIAASLKPDFANAYYNLGHALEMKNDLKGALAQYQTVRSLVTNDQASLDVINGEIKTLEEKIGSSEQAGSETQASAENQPPLEVNQPAAQLPEQEPPVKIPAPKTSVSPTPTPKPTGEVSPSLAP